MFIACVPQQVQAPEERHAPERPACLNGLTCRSCRSSFRLTTVPAINLPLPAELTAIASFFGCVEWPNGVDLCPDAMPQAMTGSESEVALDSAAALREEAKKNQ
jgi:hypothetical protein